MASAVSRVINFNKPRGWTSHDAVAYFRRKLGIKKIGHAGTLDPLATGVLVILVGQATKRQREFMNLPKEYEAVIVFGQERDTYDAQGKVVQIAAPEALRSLTESKVLQALNSFRGKIKQTVPPYSAVKVDGERLYKLAREGKISQVKLPVKEVEVYDIKLLNFVFRDTRTPVVNLRISCSSGTYIRSIAHDLGKLLGVYGYVEELTRTRVGDFRIADAETETNLKRDTIS